jgi:hypothetical protein
MRAAPPTYTDEMEPRLPNLQSTVPSLSHEYTPFYANVPPSVMPRRWFVHVITQPHRLLQPSDVVRRIGLIFSEYATLLQRWPPLANMSDGPKIALGDSSKLHEAHLSAAKFEASVIAFSFVEVVEDHFKRAYGIESAIKANIGSFFCSLRQMLGVGGVCGLFARSIGLLDRNQRLIYASLPIEGVWFIIAVLIAFGSCRSTAKRAGFLDKAPEGNKIKIGLSWFNAEAASQSGTSLVAPPKVPVSQAVQIAHRFFADAPVSRRQLATASLLPAS